MCWNRLLTRITNMQSSFPNSYCTHGIDRKRLWTQNHNSRYLHLGFIIIKTEPSIAIYTERAFKRICQFTISWNSIFTHLEIAVMELDEFAWNSPKQMQHYPQEGEFNAQVQSIPLLVHEFLIHHQWSSHEQSCFSVKLVMKSENRSRGWWIKIEPKRISSIDQEWRKFDEFLCEMLLREVEECGGFFDLILGNCDFLLWFGSD